MSIRLFIVWILLAVLARSQSVALEDLGVLPSVDETSVAAQRIRTMIAAGAFTGAEKQLTNGLEPAGTEFWWGVLELRRGNGYDAIRHLRRSQKLKEDAYATELLGLAYYSVNQFQLFEAALREASERLPKAFGPPYYLGRYYASTASADFARARQYLEHSIQLNPEYFRSFYYLGYCDEAERKLEAAARAYGESIRLAESQKRPFALPYGGMARIRILQNDFAEALSYATHAVALAEQDPEAHKTLATIYQHQGRTEDAVKEWELVTQLDSTNGAAYYRLYRLYGDQKRKDAGARALEQFRKLAHLYGTDNP